MTLTHEHLFHDEGTVSQRRVKASFDGKLARGKYIFNPSGWLK